MHPQVSKLLALPRVEQKTEEWYEMRQNMITASDFAQALGEGKFGSQKDLIKKKCTPRENETEVSRNNPFFRWGHVFEPVACAIYCRLTGSTVHEFGLLQHPRYPFFGASPDGITSDGVMVEIKCPMKRKLTGDVPTQYYYQIQGQLDVCGLDECDYIECTFEMLEGLESFKECVAIAKGFFRESPSGDITYAPPVMKQDTCPEPWQGPDCKYWFLKEHNLKRVTRDAAFVETKLEELKAVWEKILKYRADPELYNNEIVKTIDVSTECYDKKKHTKKPPAQKTSFGLQSFDTYMFLD